MGPYEDMKENCICLTKTKPVSRLGFTQETKVTSALPVTLFWHATSPKPRDTSLSQLLNPSERRAVPPTCAQGQEETCSVNWNETACCPNTQQLLLRHTIAHEEGVERGNVLSKSPEETHGHTDARVPPIPPLRLPQILKKKPMA